ncbi:chitin deacetylase [Mortierella sp. GBA43]|nr:chitin deacetylase [Mortierella sp. GBA43]
MVKIFASTLTVLLLTVSAVKAQLVVANFPKVNEVPDTKSAQVQAWLKEIDLTGAPNIAPTTAPKGSPPACAPKTDACVWTCDACAANDITQCGAPGTWGLTFDDGPSTATPKLLDFLKTNKLSASFFLIGSNVVQYPDTVKREVTEGHHLASHTWSHTALTTLTNEQIVAEMKWTEKAVMDATGLRMKYMRPPYGDINNRVRFVLQKMGYIPVDWTGDNFDTNDWRIGTKDWNLTRVISTFSGNLNTYTTSLTADPNHAGFYCLEHDVSATTVDAALELIPLGIKKNIKFNTVAGCEKDASPYQSGSTAPIPSNPAVPGTPNPSVSVSKGPAATGSPQAGNTSSNSKSAGSRQAVSAGLISAVAMAVAGAFLA